MSNSEFRHKNCDQKILQSWQRNVTPWIEAIQNGSIASRKLVTDSAIVDLLLTLNPHRLLDVGCGEGWLTREFAARQTSPDDVELWGVDGIAALVEQARALCAEGHYLVGEYGEMAEKLAATTDEAFDVMVCNFSLIGEQSVEAVFASARTLLNTGGKLVVQTLHPLSTCGEAGYRDGWREGSWAGFSEQFCDPAPWYFRTFGGWVRLFSANGLCLEDSREPLFPPGHPQAGMPASLILIGSNTGR